MAIDNKVLAQLMGNFTVGTSHTATLNAAYQLAFKRDADADGLAYWSDRLESGLSTADLVEALLNGASKYPSNGTYASLNTKDNATIVNKKELVEYAQTLDLANSEITTLLADVSDTTTSLASAKTQADTLYEEQQSTPPQEEEETPTTPEEEEEQTPSTPGEVFTLTTEVESINGTSGDDTFDASTLNSLSSGDFVTDNSIADNDTLNATINQVISPTLQNIENVNLNWSGLTGASFNAVNTNNSKLILNLITFGNDESFSISNVASNDVVAGTDVDSLTITGLTSGIVDTGSASIADITGSATHTTNVKVNGDVTIDATTFTELALLATATSVVTLDEAVSQITKTTVNGSNTITLKMSGADLDGDEILNNLTAGSLIVDITAANATLDLTDVEATTIQTAVDLGATTITVTSGTTVDINAAQTGALELTTAATDPAGQPTTATLNISKNIADLELTNTDLTATLNAVANVSIASLQSDSSNEVVLTGSKDFTITSVATSFGTLDAAALAGNLVLNTIDTAHAKNILGGKAINTITLANVDDTVVYTGQGSVDTIDATAFTGAAIVGTTSDRLVLKTGAGNDKLKVDADNLGANYGTIVFDGEAGTDVLSITGTAGAVDIKNTTFSLTAIEEIHVEVDGLNLTLGGNSLSGVTTKIIGHEDDGTNFSVQANAATTNLSGITLENITDFTITARAGASNTITGTKQADIIVAGTGQDTLTGGLESDTFVFATGTSSYVNMDSITDFKIAEDTIDLATTTTAAVVAKEVSSLVAGADDIQVKVSATGKAELEGTDKAMVNSLDLWYEIITTGNDVVAAGNNAFFEYSNNTYVVQNVLDTYDIIQLTGVKSIVGLGTAIDTNTIVIE